MFTCVVLFKTINDLSPLLYFQTILSTIPRVCPSPLSVPSEEILSLETLLRVSYSSLTGHTLLHKRSDSLGGCSPEVLFSHGECVVKFKRTE